MYFEAKRRMRNAYNVTLLIYCSSILSTFISWSPPHTVRQQSSFPMMTALLSKRSSQKSVFGVGNQSIIGEKVYKK
jgi:hypothetical protein